MAYPRRRLSLAVVLMLALVVGPGAAAACPHLVAEAAPATEHDDMEAPPCHGTPVAPPADGPADEDCLSPCCWVRSEAPATPQAEAPALALAAPVVEVHTARVALAPTRPRTEVRVDTGPPPLPERLHLLLGRFLT